MKSLALLLISLLAVPNLAQENSELTVPNSRWAKAQKYAAQGFEPIDCFAGQVRVHGKRVVREQFSVFAPDLGDRCCGKLIKTAQIDSHGHFFVEPLEEGPYFAQFEFKGAQHATSFAIIQKYDRCGSAFVEINFDNPKKPELQSFIEVDGPEGDCGENEPQCYRK
jgi:hypothetical protein